MQRGGVRDSYSGVAVTAMSSYFVNLGLVAFGLMIGLTLCPRLGATPLIGLGYGMAIGVVLGGALQLFWQVPALHKEGFHFRPGINSNHPGLRQILRMMGPAILGNAAAQINVMVNTNFASRIPGNGPVSWLMFAFRFMQLPLGLFGVPIASPPLPPLSPTSA